MKGLIYKDILLLVRSLRIYLLFIFGFALIPQEFFGNFVIVYCAMMPFSTLALDQQCGWDALAGTLPCTPRQIVLSKYVLGWGAMGCTALLAALSRSVCYLTGITEALSLQFLPVGLALALLLMAGSLPAMLRFGVEKGRFIVLFLFAASMSLIGIFDALAEELIEFSTQGPMEIGLLAVALAVQPLSILLAEKLYRIHAQ